ncbi:hypothetical protein DFH08DRAFT_1008091 [Mycena albidolilacea]|uniref:Uncharacterized protein n=1 Tax=Mycena albidolilacea TaxID=1033008 RepID=A0AAD7EQZ1_9AGAR|nr:hypothetical protein DFH08DRAFT_1008091 [Mycena albidolilacea]
MILLLLLAHSFPISGRPLPIQHPDSRAAAESCDDINSCRKLFDIIWGCLATIFAATWVSVHPNVPPPNQSRLALFWRRLRMMLMAIIAPEVMVGFAARQFVTARWYSKEYNISKAHGFFISMGGFASRTGHHLVTTPRQLRDIPRYLTDIRTIDMEDIEDKSKGDTLSKSIALLQGLWFIAQCIARVSQNLPVTELEVATFAFSVVNILIWGLWWNKPLDVQRPIRIGPHDSLEIHNSEPLISRYELDNPGASLLPGLKTRGAKLWNAGFIQGLSGALIGGYTDFEPTSYNSVPSFWSSDASEQGVNFDDGSFLMECFVGTVFGGIHCAGWNGDFPSTLEMRMWRSCSVLVAADPVIFVLTMRFSGAVSGSASMTRGVLLMLTLIYIIARLFLIVLPLVALRNPQPGMLMDVNWSAYIPHL